jgi:hypothetical protein
VVSSRAKASSRSSFSRSWQVSGGEVRGAGLGGGGGFRARGAEACRDGRGRDEREQVRVGDVVEASFGEAVLDHENGGGALASRYGADRDDA